MSRKKRALIGTVLALATVVLMGCGGGSVNHSLSASSWSGHHIVGVAADINAIMATGGCKAGSPGG